MADQDLIGQMGVVEQSTRAARMENAAMSTVRRWVNSKVPGAVADTVLTDGPGAGGQPGIYYNLTPGKRVLPSRFMFAVETLSDSCVFELGYTDAANGAGTFTPLTPKLIIATGSAVAGFTAHYVTLDPFIPITYSVGARSITVRVSANDAACAVTCGWMGWVEPESY